MRPPSRPANLCALLFLILSLAAQANDPHSSNKKTKHEAAAHDPSHWSYEGSTGPNNWGNMKPEFATCKSGTQQSPINITETYSQSLDRLQFSYQPSKLNIQNNGHTIQLNYDSGSFLTIGSDKYQLLQFHFHTPSEEAIGGKRYPMVAHLVHKNEAGQLAVVALLINQGKEDNPLFNQFWQKLPTEHKETRIFDDIQYNVANLLPGNQSYWTFMGSLTTPPCSEGVRWFVLKQPLQISAKQISRFKREFAMNARPLQSVFERAILDSN
ncbi:carbonic anhydrase family protein [Chitinibacter bivalviorum]|uniref:carbonic anhydrase n=1 Tax=Chitinibacter bivalviorum TaxID=2739434 RepID=A0A7H9BGJ7_9NEIS|nr:carbonic anhydrase family protein [Chitinibacter bivalviorum]QLG87542.1 carbonic anhydrase family protein [Chitinibacter bivalviorum]